MKSSYLHIVHRCESRIRICYPNNRSLIHTLVLTILQILPAALVNKGLWPIDQFGNKPEATH